MNENNQTKEKLTVLVIHIVLILNTIAIAMFLIFDNSSYMGRLILPGETQPTGWIFSIVILLLFGFLVGWTIIIPNRSLRQNRITNLFLFLIFIILDLTLVLLIFLSPALVILLTSPVGKLIFGS
jgi:hypothetical protein